MMAKLTGHAWEFDEPFDTVLGANTMASLSAEIITHAFNVSEKILDAAGVLRTEQRDSRKKIEEALKEFALAILECAERQQA
jgi:hypothetical protein